MKDWKERLQDLKCVNGAMYFGSYENPCDCGDEGCINQATFEDNVKELEDFIEQIISERNKEILEDCGQVAYIGEDAFFVKFADIKKILSKYEKSKVV